MVGAKGKFLGKEKDGRNEDEDGGEDSGEFRP